ncbi:MAG: hypothetical protein AAF989_03635 [Planctomycetota bacterium]
MVNSTTDSPAIEVTSTDNDFEIGSHLVGQSNLHGFADADAAIRETLQMLQWKTDRDNRYSPDMSFLILERRRGRFAFRIDEYESWQQTFDVAGRSCVGFDDNPPGVRNNRFLGAGEAFDRWQATDDYSLP